VSSLQNVSPAREISYPVSVILAPNASPRDRANRSSGGTNSTKLAVVSRFSVKGVGAAQALTEAKTKVSAMGYCIRSINHTNNGIVAYVTGGK